MTNESIKQLSVIITGIFLSALLLTAHADAADIMKSQRSGAEVKATFQYLLSDFSGPVRSQWARLHFDPKRQELYTLTIGVNEVRIYNQHGMELFSFGDTGDLVSAVDIATGENGDIYILARDFQKHAIQVHNYRGEHKAVITMQDLPVTFQKFSPDRMEYRSGLFYLADSATLQIVVMTSDGTFSKGHDLAPELTAVEKELDPDHKKSHELEISGFGVGHDGSIYFTVPTLFSAFRLNPNGFLDTFGVSGSAPGKFGVVSGIAADDQRNIYVADRLRSVVMIFDRTFNFLGEFGYRGDRSEDLIVPDDLALDQANHRVFVSQAANKGVGVYYVLVNQSR